MRAAFYKGTRPGLAGLYNRLVRFWSRGQYSHIELVFSSGLSASSSYMDGGVRYKKIDFDARKWDYIELPAHMEADAEAWFTRNAGKAYDFWSVLRFWQGWLPQGKDKYQCAEAVMAALGFDDAWRFEPNSAAAVLRRLQDVCEV